MTKPQKRGIIVENWKEGNIIMMTKPSVAELLEKVDNRYTLVIATAKRARQIAEGDKVLTKTDDVAAVSIAADEIEDGKVKVC